MAEPGTGSDLQAVKTTALKDGNQYVVNGSKTFITNGQHADLVLVVAKPTRLKGRISLMIVETGEAGSLPWPQFGKNGPARGRHV